MIKLDAGNVLLKPSHRKQLMAWMRRSLRLGDRLGDFAVTLSLQRVGRLYEVKALVHDSAGDFLCRCRQRGNWRDAMREMTWTLSRALHDQLRTTSH